MTNPNAGREALERVLRIYDSHREEATPPFRDYPSAAEAARSFVASLEQRLATAEAVEQSDLSQISQLRSQLATAEAEQRETQLRLDFANDQLGKAMERATTSEAEREELRARVNELTQASFDKGARLAAEHDDSEEKR